MTSKKLPLLTREESMRGLMPEELMSEGYIEADEFYNPAQDEDEEEGLTIAELYRNSTPYVVTGEEEEF
ncbi:hypothetical protein [Scytonema sp. PCC 10023]|uniref:hypothetical protein n=1 Tax=Scytonema sp. PCC 10023 TaxID=1680591 RepID=UPI0039C69A28